MSPKSKNNLLTFFGSDGEWKLREILTSISSGNLSEMPKDNIEYLGNAIVDILLGVDPKVALDLIDRSDNKIDHSFNNAIGVVIAKLSAPTVEEAIDDVVKDPKYNGKNIKTVQTHYYNHRKKAEEYVEILIKNKRI